MTFLCSTPFPRLHPEQKGSISGLHAYAFCSSWGLGSVIQIDSGNLAPHVLDRRQGEQHDQPQVSWLSIWPCGLRQLHLCVALEAFRSWKFNMDLTGLATHFCQTKKKTQTKTKKQTSFEHQQKVAVFFCLLTPLFSWSRFCCQRNPHQSGRLFVRCPKGAEAWQRQTFRKTVVEFVYTPEI